VFKESFAVRKQDVSASLTAIEGALQAVRHSRNLHTLLEIVLALGNYLNGGTNRGGTYGFKLKSLAKLSDCRSSNEHNFTLLSYLSTLLEKYYANVLQAVPTLAAVISEGARESLTETSAEAHKLLSGCTPIKQQLDSAACDESFPSVMSAWHGDATKTAQLLVTRALKVQTSFETALVVFAEPTQTKSDDFFGYFANFLQDCEKACTDNKRRAEALEETRKAKMHMLRKPATSETSGEFDALLLMMKKGRVFQNDVSKLNIETPNKQNTKNRK